MRQLGNSDLPGCLKLLVGVVTQDVEPLLVSVCFAQERWRARESLDAVELCFDELVHGFNVTLECFGTGGNRLVLGPHGLDHFCEQAVLASGHVTDELGPVVGLNGDLLQRYASKSERVENARCKSSRVA